MNNFQVGETYILTDTSKSDLVFPVGSRVKIIKLTHHFHPDGFTVEQTSNTTWKGKTGYAFPEELRPLTKLDKALR